MRWIGVKAFIIMIHTCGLCKLRIGFNGNQIYEHCKVANGFAYEFVVSGRRFGIPESTYDGIDKTLCARCIDWQQSGSTSHRMERLLKLLDYFRYDFDSCRRSWSRRFYAFQRSHLLMDSSHFPQHRWYDVCIYFSRLCYAICQFVIYKCFQIGIQYACRFITFSSQLSTKTWKRESQATLFPRCIPSGKWVNSFFFSFHFMFPRTETCTKRQTHIIGFGLSLIDLHNY